MGIETVVGVVKLCKPAHDGVQIVVQHYYSLFGKPFLPKDCDAEAMYCVPLREFPKPDFSTVQQQLCDQEVFVLDYPTPRGRVANITVKSGPLRERAVLSHPYDV